MNRDRYISVRLTEAMHQQLKELSDSQERSVSSYVRLLIAKDIIEAKEMEGK